MRQQKFSDDLIVRFSELYDLIDINIGGALKIVTDSILGAGFCVLVGVLSPVNPLGVTSGLSFCM